MVTGVGFAMRRDHCIPQFVLRAFRSKRLGKTYFAETGQPGVRLKPIKDIFFEDHGERLLAKEPELKQMGDFATLASDPVWTDLPAELLQRLEDRWARAVRGIVKWNESQERSSPRAESALVDVKRGPDKQEDWVPLVADYCIRTMFRSGEAARQLWERYRENEERDLANLIERQLGKRLLPTPELRKLIQDHNRARVMTGAFDDDGGMFARHNRAVTIAVWRALRCEHFIIGSRGGCWVEHEGLRYFLFPVHRNIAVSIVSRDAVNRQFPRLVRVSNPRTVLVHNMPGRSGMSVRVVNKAMWASCHSVAGIRRSDVEQALLA